MEIFDEVKFNKNKIDGHYDFVLKDGTKVSQWETPPHYYVEQIEKVNSPYKTYKEFYYTTKYLKTGGEIFYNFPVGVWREYSEDGKILKEWDEEKPYQFSIDELSIKMKGMGVDIMRKQFAVVVTRTTNPTPAYTVSYPISPTNTDDLNIVIIDGVNGNVIAKTIKTMTKN